MCPDKSYLGGAGTSQPKRSRVYLAAKMNPRQSVSNTKDKKSLLRGVQSGTVIPVVVVGVLGVF